MTTSKTTTVSVLQAKAPRTLTVIAKDINKQVATAGKAFFNIAKCLLEAQARIKADNAKQKDASKRQDIVSWANAEFSFSKAWTYKAIKLAKTFAEEEAEDAFEFVPARVLGELASMKFDKIAEVKEVAKEAKQEAEQAKAEAEQAIADGADSEEMAAKLEQHLQEIKEDAAEEVAEIYQEAKQEKAAAKADKSSTQDSKSKQAPVSSDLAELQTRNTDQAAIIEKLQGLVDKLSQENAELKRLQAERDQLAEELKQAKQEAADAKAMLKKAPALVQFKAADPASVLGLSPEQAKVKRTVNQAARMLASVYTQEQSPEEYGIIKNAKAEALELIKMAEQE